MATRNPRQSQPFPFPINLGHVGEGVPQGVSSPFFQATGNNDERVRVYRNLRTGTYSLQQHLPNENPDTKSYGKNRWIVTEHPESVDLRDVRFDVNEKARQEVIASQNKNVHAYVTGIRMQDQDLVDTPDKVNYNPYKYSSFVDENELPIHRATAIRMRPGGSLHVYRNDG